MHTARLRLELSQSRSEQREYLKNVELARVLDKREERSRATGKEFNRKEVNKRRASETETKNGTSNSNLLATVLGNVF